MWGDASRSDEPTGNFGNGAEDASISDRRVFRRSTEKQSQSSLGLFRQHRSFSDIGPSKTQQPFDLRSGTFSLVFPALFSSNSSASAAKVLAAAVALAAFS